jgi:hypothetical protein
MAADSTAWLAWLGVSWGRRGVGYRHALVGLAALWLGGTGPFTLQLSPDRHRLYALDAQTVQSPPSLHVLDTSSGVPMAMLDGPSNGQLFSVAGLFRERCGHLAEPLVTRGELHPVPVAGIAVTANPTTVLAGDRSVLRYGSSIPAPVARYCPTSRTCCSPHLRRYSW